MNRPRRRARPRFVALLRAAAAASALGAIPGGAEADRFGYESVNVFAAAGAFLSLLLGGLFLFLPRGTQAGQTMWKIGFAFIAGGLVLIILFGSNRPVKSFRSALPRLEC